MKSKKEPPIAESDTLERELPWSLPLAVLTGVGALGQSFNRIELSIFRNAYE